MKVEFYDSMPDNQTLTKWDTFVEQHPDGNIFQTSFYFNLFLNHKHFKPVLLILFDSGQLIAGVLVGIIQSLIPYFIKPLTSRGLVTGGPLTTEDHYQQLLLENFNFHVNASVVYSEFRSISDSFNYRKAFEKCQFRFEEHLNITVDLSLPTETLWKNVSRRRREQIKKAVKLGLSCRLIEDREELTKSYRILRSLYSRIRLPLLPFDLFLKAMEAGKENGYARFFGAYLDETLLGTMYTFCYKDRITNFYAGGDIKYRDSYPNSFLPWQIFLWAKDKGLTCFDWGGAGKPGVPYGVRDYKARFGGNYLNNCRYINVRKPLAYFLLQKALRKNQAKQ